MPGKPPRYHPYPFTKLNPYYPDEEPQETPSDGEEAPDDPPEKRVEQDQQILEDSS
jgi:hypothetical protein